MMPAYERMKAQLVAAVKAHVAGELHPVIPEAGTILWNVFADLSRTRTYHMSGPNPIQYREMLAWTQANRCPLEPHHVDAIVVMDQAWIEAIAEKTNPGRRAPKGNLTPELFDALF